MKKAFLILTMSILMLCSACSSQKEAVTVEGTWYSVTDATMYNFKDSAITVSGVTVGQYEDNGDSVVISLVDDGSNLQLYVTTMDGVDVLADVKEGDGSTYFCKGLENAQAFMEAEAFRVFQEYIEENLFGIWSSLSRDAKFDYIEITEDGYFTAYKGDASGEYHWTNIDIGDIVYDSGEKELCAILTIADDDAGTNAWELPITMSENAYENDCFYFGEILMHKRNNIE